ncbi:MAG: chorismate mutase [Cellulomonadaceae bacterium]|jgi:chorismate mutase|nr:chorismate mutase [Cellulomonadaceae bacterium]
MPEEILALRRSIDNIDAAMVYLLAQRFQATGQIGAIKASAGLPASDLGREAWQIARLTAIAEEAGLDVNFAAAFRAFVTAEVIRHHEHLAALAALAVPIVAADPVAPDAPAAPTAPAAANRRH